MDRYDEYFRSFYEDLRSDFGDTEYTADSAHDLAIEQVQADLRYENAYQEAWQDDLVAYRAYSEIAAIRANNPPEVSGISGGIAISILGALGNPAVIFGLGVLVGGVYVLYKLSSDDAQTSSDESTLSAQTDRMNEIEQRIKNTASLSKQTTQNLNEFSRDLNDHEERIARLEERVESHKKRLDEHDGKFSALDQALEDRNNLLTALRDDLKAQRRQPGGMLYMSTEFKVSDLADHFDRFKDPKDIDKFIRGETRTKVLEMAELWKVVIA